jgi:hypothetical protein
MRPIRSMRKSLPGRLLSEGRRHRPSGGPMSRRPCRSPVAAVIALLGFSLALEAGTARTIWQSGKIISVDLYGQGEIQVKETGKEGLLVVLLHSYGEAELLGRPQEEPQQERIAGQ